MCCSAVHDKSPKYKCSNCCGVFGIVIEFLSPIVLVLALLAVFPVGLWSCTHFEKPQLHWAIGFLQLYAGPPGCQNSGWRCYNFDSTVTGSSGSSSGTTSSDTTRRLKGRGFHRRTPTMWKDNLAQIDHKFKEPLANTAKSISLKKSEKEMKKQDYYALRYIENQLNTTIFTQHLSHSRNKVHPHRRLNVLEQYVVGLGLGDKLTEMEADYDQMKADGKSICAEMGSTFTMLIVAIVFCVIQIILSAVNACNCCYKCCGGYKGHQLCNGGYSIVSTVMAIVPLTAVSAYRNNVTSLSTTYTKWFDQIAEQLKKINFTMDNYPTSSNYNLIATVSIFNAAFYVLLLIVILRAGQCILSFVAGASTHIPNDAAKVNVANKQIVIQQSIPTNLVAVAPVSQAGFKFCSNCGTKVALDTKFCPSCGHKEL